MNYQESLDYLYSRLPIYQRQGKAAMKPNLNNTLRLLDYLGNPHKKFRSVHIAGTNGKGSSAHALAAILQSAGYKTGLYTSPHLQSFTERIRINGKPIRNDAVADFTTRMVAQVEEIQPSFFEMTVAMAFDYFNQEKVDIAIIEVGLGGRLDSTNVITPEVSLITSIGYDHMDLLGDTLPKIAKEKAGIIKHNTPVVIGTLQEETIDVFKTKALEMQSDLIVSDDVTIKETKMGSATIEYKKKQYKLDIAAAYYCKNIPGVLESVEVLRSKGFKILENQIQKGLAQMKELTGLKGRFQIINRKPLTIADVSHNEDGIKALFQQIDQFEYAKLHIVYGTVSDKQIDTILQLLPRNVTFYWTEADIPRALPSVDLKNKGLALNLHGEGFSNVNEAIAEAAKKASDNDLILVTGSTFVVAEIDGL